MKSLASVCLATVLLTACATTMEYEKKFSNWVGQSVDDLYAKLGKPSSTQPQADGGSIVSYERKEVVPITPDSKNAKQSNSNDKGATVAAGTPVTNSPATEDKTRTVSCTTRYKTDSTGVVRSWTFDGEGCKAHEEDVSQQQ